MDYCPNMDCPASCSPGSITADPWRVGHGTVTRPSTKTQTRLVGWGWGSAGTRVYSSIYGGKGEGVGREGIKGRGKWGEDK